MHEVPYYLLIILRVRGDRGTYSGTPGKAGRMLKNAKYSEYYGFRGCSVKLRRIRTDVASQNHMTTEIHNKAPRFVLEK